ncbi:hypothetical protein DASC09_008370 [Saccharomycopsis crataegensis]|uniref:Major facilitator superfamily (MFS) profile domain-containing protein n=1 Tax=Saccharomycopsis crataegensis TaxID=43959 RepID=A0AAV5QFV9_9ASCO|nr:hypothetical protein DASC09_008370 [Saccharomycopsis crataegensis]
MSGAQKELLEEPYHLNKNKIDNVVSFAGIDSDLADIPQYSKETKDLKIKELASIYNVDEKKLLRKIDLCVIPPFCLLYFLAYFNRSSFGFIQMAGIEEDLHMSNLSLYASYSAFFAPYIFFQFFANILMKSVRPHFWISISVLLYGVDTLASAFSKNYAAYTGLHFLHGIVQAGSETAIFYILAHYYTTKESQKRFSAIYSVSCLAGICSNLIAYGVNKNLNGDNGWMNWKWALIVYGSLTMFSAVVLFFILPDFPEGARFFDDDETFFLIKKLEIYNGKSGYGLDFQVKDVTSSLSDPLIWLPAISSLGISYATYVYAFHEPQIMSAVDFNGTKNISYGSYPWVVAFIWCNLSAHISDFIGKKYPVILGNLLIAMVGSILIFAPSDSESATRYAGCFLVALGGYAALPMILCWSTLNVGGHVRKSMVTSLQISFGSIGGLIALFTFYNQESKARVPFYVSLGFQALTAASATAYLVTCTRQNQIKRTSQYKEKYEDFTERDAIILGDKHPNFDYLT